MSAKALYQRLSNDRDTVLEVARRCAALTIPAVLPPDGTNNSSPPKTPYQALGAYCVNNLAAKVMLALYPQGTSFFRLVIPESVSAASDIPPDQRAEIVKRLAGIENRALQKFEASVVRAQKTEVILHLIVTGNVLTYFRGLDKFRVFRLDQYVCKRDASGNPLDVVVHETVPPTEFTADERVALNIPPEQKKAVSVYTHITWSDGRCRWHQEVNDKAVPGSAGSSPVESSPWNPLRWKAVPGMDYGRGHCEEYLGDLLSLEGLSQAIVEFAAVASKILLVVKPGAQTNVGEVNRARSGDAITGSLDDIGILQLDKYADFQVVQRVKSEIEERVSRAFLLRSGVTRDAERVTAEEVRGTAQELEDALGGVYTVLAMEEQYPFVRRLLAVLTKDRVIPALPQGAVEPTVVTGFQALGRNHELNRIRGFVGDLTSMFGPEVTARYINLSDIAARLASGWGVTAATSLIKSADTIAAEDAAAQQAAMAQTVIEKGTGPAVSAMAAPQ